VEQDETISLEKSPRFFLLGSTRHSDKPARTHEENLSRKGRAKYLGVGYGRKKAPGPEKGERDYWAV
jgi:hypothetical protein